MKVLQEEISQTFDNDFTTKKVLVEIDRSTDVDVFPAEQKTFLVLYKKDKLIGFISGTNKSNIIVPRLYSLNLINKKAGYGVFNTRDGKMVYRGNDKPEFNENGFILKKNVQIKMQFNSNGKMTCVENTVTKTKAKKIEDLFLGLD